jgi:hypothetical protein
MLKPPAPTIPGMTDTLEFVKNLWGGMNVPGAAGVGMPGASLSTDELDKRIADLKAVEAWLNMNTTMLRGTIQTLEIQRGTIATLRSVGASMAQAMGQASEQAGAMSAPFAQFFAQPGAGAAPAGTAAPAGPSSRAPGTAAGGPQAGAAKPGAEAPPGAAALPAAVAWWNLLQDQFTQAVSSAMSPEVMAGAAAMAQDAATRFATASSPPAKAGGEPEAGSGAADQAGAAKAKSPKAGPGKG